MQVAGGAADDERQADARHELMVRQAGRVHADADERRRRDDRDHDGLEREVDGVQDAERRAGVAHVREVEEARDDRDARRAAAASRGRAPWSADRATTIDERQPELEPAAAPRHGVADGASAMDRLAPARPDSARRGRPRPARSRPRARTASSARTSRRRRVRWSTCGVAPRLARPALAAARPRRR